MTQTLKSILLKIKQRSEIKRTIKELEAMSDRDLYDIGISRYDIPMIAEQSIN